MLTRFAHGEYYAKMMASQKKISAFFTTTTKAPLKLLSENAECLAKRKSESAKKSSPSPKKQKTLEAGVSPQSATHTSAKLSALENDTLGLVRNFGSSWLPALEPEFKKPYFINLCSFVADERKKYTIYPKAENVFSWTTACKLRDVKVVILGQDPYHGPNQAHGLCFSVMKGVNTPPSLQNMYKELDKDIPEFSKPDHGYLMGWASQGVLLLNAVLTVRAGNANSHKDKGWEKLTDAVIQYLNKNTSNLVFMLWGSYAQKKGSHISQKKHRILKGVHPSPLSAHRGYFGCKHFSQANEYLLSHGKKAIDWNHLP